MIIKAWIEKTKSGFRFHIEIVSPSYIHVRSAVRAARIAEKELGIELEWIENSSIYNPRKKKQI